MSPTKCKTVFEPIADRIVIKRDETTEFTPGGLVLPDEAKKKPLRGKVIAVGPGKVSPDATRKYLAMQSRVGDTVLFSQYGGDTVEIDDEEFTVISEGEVLAILR